MEAYQGTEAFCTSGLLFFITKHSVVLHVPFQIRSEIVCISAKQARGRLCLSLSPMCFMFNDRHLWP